jgi:hypothetical protein
VNGHLGDHRLNERVIANHRPEGPAFAGEGDALVEATAHRSTPCAGSGRSIHGFRVRFTERNGAHEWSQVIDYVVRRVTAPRHPDDEACARAHHRARGDERSRTSGMREPA